MMMIMTITKASSLKWGVPRKRIKSVCLILNVKTTHPLPLLRSSVSTNSSSYDIILYAHKHKTEEKIAHTIHFKPLPTSLLDLLWWWCAAFVIITQNYEHIYMHTYICNWDDSDSSALYKTCEKIKKIRREKDFILLIPSSHHHHYK